MEAKRVSFIQFNFKGIAFWLLFLFTAINTTKIYSQDLEWFNQIKNIYDDIDINDLTIDPAGNIYIGGSYDDQKSLGVDNSASNEVDFMGTTPASNTHEQMGFLAKLNSAGVIQWMNKFGSTQSTSGYSPLATVEKNGFLYAVGSFEYSAAPGLDFDPGAGTNNIQSGGNVDFFISKYNTTTGAMVWAYKCSGSNGSDLATGITIDNNENIYVTGTVNNGATACDFNVKAPGMPSALGIASKQHLFLAKYTKDCDFVWRTNITNSSSGNAGAIAIDLVNSYVYFAGGIAQVGGLNPVFTGTTLTCSAGTANECFIAKYDFNGVCQYVKNTARITSNSLSNLIRSMDIDAVGNIYVSGTLGSTSDFDPSAGTSSLAPIGSFDGFVAKYTSAGTLTWKYGIGSASFGEAIHSIDVTPTGNIFIGGALHGQAESNPEGTGGSKIVGSNNVYNIFFGQYDTDFKWKWTYGITAATTASVIGNEANAVAIDENNALAPVYVFGYMHAASGVTQNFNPSGAGVFAPSLVPQTGTGAVGGNNANGFLAKYSTSDILLPIELISFEASCKNKMVELRWQTASELNNNYFTIQRSLDGINWIDLSIISAKGNSTNITTYNYVDNSPLSEISYYRLKQTDFDKKTKIFNVVYINCDDENNPNLTIYPNPVGSDLNVNIKGYKDNDVFIFQLFDSEGKLIIENTLIYNGEIKTINVDSLSSGLYMVHILGNKVYYSQKIVKN